MNGMDWLPSLAAGAGAGGLSFVSMVLIRGLAVLRRQRRRRVILQREFPTLLDGLVLRVEAGSALLPAFLHAARVFPPNALIREEVARLDSDIRCGLPQGAALANLRRRMGFPLAETSLSALSQALELGTPVAGVLREEARRTREYLLLEGERQANTLPVRLLAPLIFFIFPAAFLVILSPVIVALAGILG